MIRASSYGAIRTAALPTTKETGQAGHELLLVQKTVFFFFFFLLFFLQLHLGHMEVPRLGVRSELQLPAYTIATAMLDPSPACTPKLKATPDP